ncbi:MAG: tetratricopeptide repeat protein [Bacteroidales bacterium]|nr:tetratricopeptide repeat protein [Bacteroidales bacterium]
MKTLGRPNAPGKALPGVTVRVAGVHNALLSDKRGRFSFILDETESKDDDFTFSSVYKSGYSLSDSDFLNQKFAFSPKVPVTIVMVSNAVLEQEKHRIEMAAYARADQNYKTKLDALQKALDESRISGEQYRNELVLLQKNYDKYTYLIGDMADRYARADYDNLSKLDRQINACIEAGDLEEAERLIRTVLDPEKVVQQNRDAQEEIARQRLALERGLQENERKEAARLAQQEIDAKHLYDLHTIALGRFQSDSAAYYLIQRAELDTNNFRWQLKAADFLRVFLNDYTRAEVFYNRGCSSAAESNGRQSAEYASCLNSISVLYGDIDRYKDALVVLQEALNIRKEHYPDNVRDLALLYNNFGRIYLAMSRLDSAEEALNTAYGLLKDSDYKRELAETLSFLARLKGSRGMMNDAVAYSEQALDILKEYYPESREDILLYQSEHALRIKHAGEYEDAIAIMSDCLEDAERIFGHNNRTTAALYDSMAGAYEQLGHMQKALELHTEALIIREAILGENSMEVSESYNNVANDYVYLQDYEKAISYMQKSLEIVDTLLGRGTPSEAHVITSSNLANIYWRMNENDKAREINDAALQEAEKLYGVNTVQVCRIYSSNAALCANNKDYETAIRYFEKALEIAQTLEGENRNEIYVIESNIGECYTEIGNYPAAFEYLERSARSIQQINDKDLRHKAILEGNFGNAYYRIGDFDKFINHFVNSAELYRDIYGDGHDGVYSAYYMLMIRCYGNGRLTDAIRYGRVAIESYEAAQATGSAKFQNALNCVYVSFHELFAKMSPSEELIKQYDDFMSDKGVTFSVAPDGPAAKAGLSGNYLMLEFPGWDINSRTSLFDAVAAMKGKEKTVVLYKEGDLYQNHFEDAIGAGFNVMIIGQQTKQHLISEYERWKNSH